MADRADVHVRDVEAVRERDERHHDERRDLRFCSQLDDAALGAPAHGSRDVQRRRLA